MKNLLIGAAVALSLSVPGAALAQRNAPAPVVLVVDTERVFTECNACRAATPQLQAQAQQYNQRAQQLQAQLQRDGTPLDAAMRALNGRQPDAALQQRINAFQQSERAAAEELEGRQQQLRSVQAHIQQQIGVRLVPILEQIRAARGATIVVSRNSTFAHNPAAEITNEALTQLNAVLPSVNVTPLPPQQQAQPGIQPPAQPQPGR
jgi:Skp family chaperone for outer membrane proteins